MIKNPDIHFYVLCGFWEHKLSLPSNCTIREKYARPIKNITLSARILFYHWVSVQSFYIAMRHKPYLIWHFLPNGPSSFNLFILLKMHKLFKMNAVYGPLQSFHNGLDTIQINNEKPTVLKDNIYQNIISKAYIFTNYYLKQFNKLIYISKSAEHSYKKLLINPDSCNNKSSVISNGVSLEKFLPVKNNLNDKINLLFVGNLTQNKRVDLVLHLALQLHHKSKLGSVTIVGDGIEMNALKILSQTLGLEKLCKFTGSIPNDQVSSYFTKSHFLCLFSEREGFPHVILEAMSSGIPVLLSNFEFANEIVDSYHCGYILTDRNENGIRSLVEEIILLDDTKYQSIKANNIINSKKHDWPFIIQQYSNIISKSS